MIRLLFLLLIINVHISCADCDLEQDYNRLAQIVDPVAKVDKVDEGKVLIDLHNFPKRILILGDGKAEVQVNEDFGRVMKWVEGFTYRGVFEVRCDIEWMLFSFGEDGVESAYFRSASMPIDKATDILKDIQKKLDIGATDKRINAWKKRSEGFKRFIGNIGFSSVTRKPYIAITMRPSFDTDYEVYLNFDTHGFNQ